MVLWDPTTQCGSYGKIRYIIHMKNKIKSLLKKIHSSILLELNFLYDYKKFKKNYTKEGNYKNDNSTKAWILQDKHRLEKAFSLPVPRFGFGEQVIERLIKNLRLYSQKDNIYYIGVGALKAYKIFHEMNNVEVPIFYTELIKKIPNEDLENKKTEISGFLKSSDIKETENVSTFKEFSESRYSCRNYNKNKVITPEILREITELTITAPSVCNRQHWKIYFLSGKKKDFILKLQNGNIGFTDNIPMIALVVSDISAFYTPNERNQAYTDGGIFAMNLMYAIQSKGMQSCPLNWCSSYINENKIEKAKIVKPNESAIVVIAFGYPNKNATYAKSPRLPVENFYEVEE